MIMEKEKGMFDFDKSMEFLNLDWLCFFVWEDVSEVDFREVVWLLVLYFEIDEMNDFDM